MGKKYKIPVNRGYGSSMGNMLEAFSGEHQGSENWIEVERKAGIYYLIDNSMTVKNGNWVVDNTQLAFAGWDETVQNIDKYSEEGDIFDMSNKLKWNEVILEPNKFQAKTIERLQEALQHVSFCAWCAGDI
jgi:hypothetical protein